MTCHGGFSLDEQTRRSWINPEATLQNLQRGMTFIDVGCGDGFFSVLAAKAVGPKGKVYAVDSDASAIEKLAHNAQAEGVKNIVCTVGLAEKTVFCRSCADFVFFSMALHDFANPAKVLENARVMVKPMGRLIDLDWKKEHMSFGPPYAVRFSVENASNLLIDAGFQVVDVNEDANYHYVLTAKPSLYKIKSALC